MALPSSRLTHFYHFPLIIPDFGVIDRNLVFPARDFQRLGVAAQVDSRPSAPNFPAAYENRETSRAIRVCVNTCSKQQPITRNISPSLVTNMLNALVASCRQIICSRVSTHQVGKVTDHNLSILMAFDQVGLSHQPALLPPFIPSPLLPSSPQASVSHFRASSLPANGTVTVLQAQRRNRNSEKEGP